MNRENFLDLWYSEMDFYNEFTREDITEEMYVHHFSEWDSLSRATVYNFILNELGVKLAHADIAKCVRISDVMKLAGIHE